MNDANKMFIWMVILTIAVAIMVFFMPGSQKDKRQQDVSRQETERTVEPDEEKLPSVAKKFELIETPQEQEYNLTFENDNIKVVFDPADAIIKSAYIKSTFLDKGEAKEYDIVRAKKGEPGAMQLRFGGWDSELTIANLTGGDNTFHYERDGDIFTFTCQLKNIETEAVYTIVKKYTFVGNENLFKLDLSIFNDKNEEITVGGERFGYSIGWGPSLGDEDLTNSKRRVPYDKLTFMGEGGKRKVETRKGGFFMFGGQNFPFQTDDDFEGKNARTIGGWVAADSQYFSAIILPDRGTYTGFYDYRKEKTKKFYTGFSRPGGLSQYKSSFYVYIGPKISSFLTKYDDVESFNLKNTKITAIEDKILWGLGNLIGNLLAIIYGWVGNYGLAIILLTMLIKLITLPLTYKSMLSQEKMGKLQPKLKELQEKYKDKPEMLNRKTMEFYKKEGINPLGGCLPMLLQMPILMAMYRLLDRMVQLKGATFLWISDLSMPDAVLTFPFTIPVVNVESLNILPILMVGVQIVTSFLTPSNQSNKQAQTMMWMLPLVFFFLFYNVSSGLVLYWTVMNLFNLIQQVVMKRLQSSGVIKK